MSCNAKKDPNGTWRIKYRWTDWTGTKGFNGLALCDIEDGDYDSALSDIESGIHVAGAEDIH